ncbi:MAG: MurR/RpiR family transcriptional regulator [Firmicutes bacterium]|nr:MurR/RpiR family transcriptional regulator [Bacillota bacterium]
MKTGLEKLREERFSFRQSERKAAEYILAHTTEVINLPITQLAEQIGVSEATIVRMCKKVGFRGFQELKIALAMETVPPLKTVHEAIQEDDDTASVLQKVFFANISAMESTLNVLSIGELDRAVEAIAAAERIYLFGVGGSAPIAIDAAHKLMKTGKAVIAYTDTHMQAMAASLMQAGDVVIGISHSGSSRDIIESLELARKNGAVTIGLTNHARAPMDRVLDIKLSTCSNETFYRTESTSSRIAQLSIIDTLFIVLSLRQLEQALDNLQRTREAIVPKRY